MERHPRVPQWAVETLVRNVNSLISMISCWNLFVLLGNFMGNGGSLRKLQPSRIRIRSVLGSSRRQPLRGERTPAVDGSPRSVRQRKGEAWRAVRIIRDKGSADPSGLWFGDGCGTGACRLRLMFCRASSPEKALGVPDRRAKSPENSPRSATHSSLMTKSRHLLIGAP